MINYKLIVDFLVYIGITVKLITRGDNWYYGQVMPDDDIYRVDGLPFTADDVTEIVLTRPDKVIIRIEYKD